MRDIFVPLFQKIDCIQQLDAAARLAPRLNAHINVVFTRPDAVMAAAAIPDMLVAAGVVLESIDRDDKEARHSAIAQFEAWRIANRLMGSPDADPTSNLGATWHERVGPVAKTVTEIGRLSDLIVIHRPEPYEVITDEVFTAAIYASGRPTLIVPERIVDDPLDHIVIAWNGSLEAARAVDGAMPMLRAAKRVSIFSATPRANELSHDLGLIEHLSRHGIRAEVLPTRSEAGDVGAQLLRTAGEDGVTMIVMGAYTHNRVREVILGGVTHHVVRYADIPVMMMH